MPRNFDCGFLSSDAVEKEVDSALANDVFPESTWPNIPTETLQTRRRRRPRLCSGGGGVDGEDIIIPRQSVFLLLAIYIRLHLRRDFFFVFFFTVEFFVSLLFNSSLKYEYEREEFYPKMPPPSFDR